MVKWHLIRRCRWKSDASPSCSPVACICEHVGSQIVAFRTLLKPPEERVVRFATDLDNGRRSKDAHPAERLTP